MIDEENINYIKITIPSYTKLEEIIAYLEDLNRENKYTLETMEITKIYLKKKETNNEKRKH